MLSTRLEPPATDAILNSTHQPNQSTRPRATSPSAWICCTRSAASWTRASRCPPSPPARARARPGAAAQWPPPRSASANAWSPGRRCPWWTLRLRWRQGRQRGGERKRRGRQQEEEEAAAAEAAALQRAVLARVLGMDTPPGAAAAAAVAQGGGAEGKEQQTTGPAVFPRELFVELGALMGVSWAEAWRP